MPSAKRFLLVTLLWLAATASAFCQSPQFPQNLPGSTVIGRLGTQPGPSQAVPFAVLFSQFQLLAGAVGGPGSSTTAGDLALWNNATGTALKDGGTPGAGVLNALTIGLNTSGGLLTAPTLPSGLTIPSPTLTGTLGDAEWKCHLLH
jgi:hypothetical protein